MVQQGFFGAGHQERATAIRHLVVTEEAFLLDVPILVGPEGVVETCGQPSRDAGVDDHAFGDHIVETQSPQSAEIGRPAEMLGQDGGVVRTSAGVIRQRVHAPPEVDDLSLFDPPRQLETDRWSPVGKCLRQEREVEADQPTHKTGQVV